MPTDWIQEWKDYVERTGRRPSQADPDSRRIYNGIHNGVKKGWPGYREFWAEHRIGTHPEPTDWLTKWIDYDKQTGKRPSTSDPDSKSIYLGVARGARKGRPGYKEFFDLRRIKHNKSTRTSDAH